MKRYISESFKNLNGEYFTGTLVDTLRQLLPKNCRPMDTTDYMGYQITVEHVPSYKKLHEAIVKSLELLGYKVYDIKDVDDEGYHLAAVKGEAFAKLIIDVGDYFNRGELGYVELKFDNGNVIFQDWYKED